MAGDIMYQHTQEIFPVQIPPRSLVFLFQAPHSKQRLDMLEIWTLWVLWDAATRHSIRPAQFQ